MQSSRRNLRVGITMGDPSGIGPAILHKAIVKLEGLAQFVVIGDGWVLDHATRSPCLAGRRARHRVTGVELIDLKNVSRKDFKFGKIKAEYGRASMEYLDKAMELIKSREIDCLVTCPISKESINQTGFRWSGHTEYLARRAGVVDYAMMLLNEQLKTVLITRHIPLKSVPTHLDADKINKTILLAFNSLKKLFLIKEPRIVLCGVNPHASDNGVIGNEENDIIKPALEKLRKKIRYLDGPLSADVAISKALSKHYDCVVAMYHDQALIPLKILGPDTGVNMTLGLGFIRTSPLHGTAFDIAGKYGLSNPHSLIAAIKLSIKCSLNQKNA